jgi:hypothetical protein
VMAQSSFSDSVLFLLPYFSHTNHYIVLINVSVTKSLPVHLPTWFE